MSAPAHAPAEVRRRRRRTLLVLVAISVGWKVLVLTLGTAVPRWVVKDGVDEQPAARRAYAESALHTARRLWNHPVERFGLVQALRVTSVDSVPGASPGCGALGARVKAYMYFAIPYSEVRTVCDTGVVEYRVFRRRGSRRLRP
ncbi:MAG: hypothetical protein ACJ8AO_03490 [Gemmatimonadaceae bacterium]